MVNGPVASKNDPAAEQFCLGGTFKIAYGVITGDGVMTNAELSALVPGGVLQQGWYLVQRDSATYLGPDLPHEEVDGLFHGMPSVTVDNPQGTYRLLQLTSSFAR